MKTMSRITIALAVAALGMARAFPFTMEPMTALLGPSGPGSVASFTIANDGAERIALRFSILTRGLSPQGKEINAPADDLFLVYPSRMVVEPGSSAVVKLMWKGPAKVSAERPFRFVAEQLPMDAVSSKIAGSGIKVMFRYIASVYVGDVSFAPNLIATVTGAKGPKGENGYLVEIDNIGNRHVVPNDLAIVLQGVGESRLGGDALGHLSGSNYLPGSGRTAFVPGTDAVPGKSYEAKLEYDREY